MPDEKKYQTIQLLCIQFLALKLFS